MTGCLFYICGFWFQLLCPTSRQGIQLPRPDHLVSNLSRPYSREDVVHALHSMSSTKTPGPDGFSTIFYQLYWDVVGDDVSRVVLQILNENHDPTEFNDTYIALIPKISQATLPSHFRPLAYVMSR